jgi:hypothetical protein
VQLVPFGCFQVETLMESKNILGSDEDSYRKGDCEEDYYTGNGNPRK